MFKIGDEVVIVNKRSINFGKTATVKNVHGFSEVLISIKGGWSGWVTISNVEPVKKPSVKGKQVKDSPKKIVPFIAFSGDDNNFTKESVRDKIENDHDDTTVLFGDTFENMKDKIINTINDTWGHDDDWDNIYVVSGEDYFHIGKQVVVRKL